MNENIKPINGFIRFVFYLSVFANFGRIISNIADYINPFNQIETWLFICNIISNIVIIVSFLLTVAGSDNKTRKIGVTLFISWILLYGLLGCCLGEWVYVYMAILHLVSFSLLMLLRKDNKSAWTVIFNNEEQANPEHDKCDNTVSEAQLSSVDNEVIEVFKVEEIIPAEETIAEDILEKYDNVDSVETNILADANILAKEEATENNNEVESQPLENPQSQHKKKINNHRIRKVIKIIAIVLICVVVLAAIPFIYLGIRISTAKYSIVMNENTISLTIPKYANCDDDFLLSIDTINAGTWKIKGYADAQLIEVKNIIGIDRVAKTEIIEFDIREYLQSSNYNEETRQYLAYRALVNNDKIPFNVYIGDFKYDGNITLYPLSIEQQVTVIQGKCAKAYPNKLYTKRKLQLIQDFVIDSELPSITMEQAGRMFALFNDMRNPKIEHYQTFDNIPVVSSAEDLGHYTISSKIKADYYYLALVSSEEEIKDIVKEIIKSQFAKAQTSNYASFDVYNPNYVSGYKCLVYIAINEDWSYTAIPIGVIAINNTTPQNYACKCIPDDFLNIGNMSIDLLGKKLYVDGYAYVGSWQYDDHEWTTYVGNVKKVDLTIYHFGDTKSMIIRRTQDLCYRDKYSGRGIYPETKIIDLTNKPNPYIFSILLHLENGYNKIPYMVEDNFGNKRHGYVSINRD